MTLDGVDLTDDREGYRDGSLISKILLIVLFYLLSKVEENSSIVRDQYFETTIEMLGVTFKTDSEGILVIETLALQKMHLVCETFGRSTEDIDLIRVGIIFEERYF